MVEKPVVAVVGSDTDIHWMMNSEVVKVVVVAARANELSSRDIHVAAVVLVGINFVDSTTPFVMPR
jgi:hypothetical protein